MHRGMMGTKPFEYVNGTTFGTNLLSDKYECIIIIIYYIYNLQYMYAYTMYCVHTI